MSDSSSPVLRGRLSAVFLQVADVDRAARFFGSLLDAEFTRRQFASHAEQRIVSGSPIVPERIDVVFTDAAAAVPERLCFECEDVAAAADRAVALGGEATDPDSVADDQGVPLRFTADSVEAGDRAASSALGVVIVEVPDTAKGRRFYERLFGLSFVRVGSGDFWWVESGPSMGIFPITHDLTNPPVPRDATGVEIAPFFCVADLDAAMARVSQLGGETREQVRFGPYRACHCRDDGGLRFALWCAREG